MEDPRASSLNVSQPALKVVDLKKSFDGRPVLKSISFEVYPGETLGIIGPSGCGKSTILKLVCGLIQPDGGQIIKASEEIGLVFQGSALLNSLSVRENLRLALRNRRMSRREQDEQIEKTLRLVGLGDHIDHFPAELSGGQQKRTSFARAVVYNPPIILYDEPTTGLDPVMSTIIEDYMIELEKELRAASIVVTHQLSTWTRTADRVIMMHAGRVVWEGKPSDAMASDNAFIHQFAHASREGPMLQK
ncbi:MAG: ATP-binding cassette domain-containing protein [Candidatus Obscuribacterales bacterium]|nr:ATP-binding cassette domain-containing protein [Candidatus Obscuribacterales bacterium]